MKKVFLILMALLFTRCNMFEKNSRLALSLKSPTGELIEIYFVQLGATTSDVLQICSIDKLQNKNLLGAFKHNYVKEAKFISRDTLFLVLSDTSYYGESFKKDSVRLNIFKPKNSN